jgi:hypothetical protein
VGTGRERFVGCLDANHDGSCNAGEPAGAMRFSFVYWAAFDPASGALLKGRCVHPIIGGAGSFAHASGVVFMRDTPIDGGVRTTYTGTLAYDASDAPSALTAEANVGAAAPAGAVRGACGR